MADQSYENLSHSKLINVPSKDNREVSLQIDVWGGNTSLVIFTPGGGRPWKITLPPKVRYMMRQLIERMREELTTQRQPIDLNAYNQEQKKFNVVGCIGFGFDEKLNFYIDVAHKDLQGRHMFILKPDGRFDTHQTKLSERDNLNAVLDWFSDVIVNVANTAERMTSFKRTGGAGGGGGNRGGGGGSYGGRGGGNSGGGGSYDNGGTFGGGGSGDDQLHL